MPGAKEKLSQLKAHPRWWAIVSYRTRNGVVCVDHLFEELRELHDLIELGPDWETIEDITIKLNPRRRQQVADYTTEESMAPKLLPIEVVVEVMRALGKTEEEIMLIRKQLEG